MGLRYDPPMRFAITPLPLDAKPVRVLRRADNTELVEHAAPNGERHYSVGGQWADPVAGAAHMTEFAPLVRLLT